MQQLLDTAEKIRSMEIRGAGRIATAAAKALRDYVEMLETSSFEEFVAKVEKAKSILIETRPTAVSLPNAVMLAGSYDAETVEEARSQILDNATEFIRNADNALDNIGEIGAKRLRDGDTVMTHCNSHAALAIIKTAHKQGKRIKVYATESRPRRQGFITIKELSDAGIDTTLIVDSAVRYTMKNVDTVIVGADSITVNGALVNKIGTSQLALAAHEARVNFISAAETYKFSPSTLFGDLVEIEERDPDEVIPSDKLGDMPDVKISNPAFDVTPSEYIDLIVTEAGAFPPEMAYVIIKEHLGWELKKMG
ncbi:ribose 1,5-bisphosphate isomerase [Methanohalophilus mahii]|uniref:Ribose 1,5-bisphosphate isomerase n=1 Tax=Methanohalophilus mahii (strain ATCC 35705 / DSM 5219 / SLP) TaxID=547558 RepID=D5E956_METMS|nr:ribose 1,5-bisphosphate isomerase [Methanohalophilus mahii]ADE35707.1 ribose 1,5-bisphosphate isomerase [Methanohalophilus mahii DSM 5219]